LFALLIQKKKKKKKKLIIKLNLDRFKNYSLFLELPSFLHGGLNLDFKILDGCARGLSLGVVFMVFTHKLVEPSKE